jgi:hypothetical protein
VNDERFGAADESIRTHVNAFDDLSRLTRMLLRAVKAANWREVAKTP